MSQTRLVSSGWVVLSQVRPVLSGLLNSESVFPAPMTWPSWSSFVFAYSFFILEAAEQETLVWDTLGRLAGKGKSGGPWLSKLVLGKSAHCFCLRLLVKTKTHCPDMSQCNRKAFSFSRKQKKNVLINDVTFIMGFSSPPQLL